MKKLKTGDGVTIIPMSDVLEITEAYIAFRTLVSEVCSVVTKVDRENGIVTFDTELPDKPDAVVSAIRSREPMPCLIQTGKRRRKGGSMNQITRFLDSIFNKLFEWFFWRRS